MLYYLGAMQAVIRAIARLLHFAMETSPMESFATAAHIFVGQVGIIRRTKSLADEAMS